MILPKSKSKRTQKPNSKGRSGSKRKNRPKRSLNAPRVKGHGDYLVDAGEYLGGKAGAYLGGKAGGLISSLVTGHGDYKVSQNSLVNSVPDFSNSGEIRVRHREFLRNVVSSVGFTSQQLQIQLTNSSLFPYISKMAKAFDEWELNGALVTFKTLSGSVTTNQALGSVVLATQYNPYDIPFKSKAEMENYQYSTSTVPSSSMIHAIECDPKLRQQSILSVLPPNGPQDQRFFVFGNLNVATEGQATAGAVIGELWVTYDITLRIKAQRSLTTSQHLLNTTGTGVTDGTILGTGYSTVGASLITVGASGVCSFQPGVFGMFKLRYYRNSDAPNTGGLPVFDTPVNCAIVSDIWNYGSSSVAARGSVTAGRGYLLSEVVVQVLADLASIKISYSAASASATDIGADLYVDEMAYVF
jgi:hypothetical protein